ncbi:MAG TPA: NHL repeat-containing protein [Burkholderiaceae bacterium]|nr:NHL repeat-containing protein [Burkholderiaceae bacterium]
MHKMARHFPWFRLLASCLLGASMTQAGCGGGAASTQSSPQPTLAAGLYFIAGSVGGGGYTLDGTGAAARFSGPEHIAADGDGNLYVTDDTTVRKVTPQGVVATVAGTPGQGGDGSGLDGIGAAARFYPGRAITADASGNAYVADVTGIRKVTPAGVVTTVNAAVGAAIAIDRAGNLYFTQTHCGVKVACYWTVEKLSPDGTLASLVTSAGQIATFGMLKAIAVDAAGNVYVSESSTPDGNRIRKMTPAGQITDAAGAGTGLSFDGIALDDAGNLYAADAGNDVIYTITQAGAAVVLAGSPGVQGSDDGTGPAARFNLPHDIVADAAGNLYVADTGNHTVRRIEPDGTVTTLAGTGMGRIYGSADGIGAAAQFTNPQGVAADAQGNLYVADTAMHTIRRVTPAGAVTTWAGSAGMQGDADGVGAAARFNLPTDVAVDASGNLYVTDAGNRTIRKVTPQGMVSTLAGSPGLRGTVDGTGAAARFTHPQGITIDPAGNLYVTDSEDTTIRRITPQGVVTTFAGSLKFSGSADGIGAAAQLSSPHGITIDQSGNLYVADTGNGSIRKITPAALVTTLPGTAGRFYGANGIAADLAGNLYVTNVLENRYPALPVNVSTISRIAPDGTMATIAGKANQQRIELGDLPGSLELPFGIARVGAGTFALTSGSSVLKLVIQ